MRGAILEGPSSSSRLQQDDDSWHWQNQHSTSGSSEAPSWLDSDTEGPKPSELYGKFTWKIETFSEISKRELRSNIFEVGSYKWYILVYPQGCDVCNHLSLFLCVADYDKLLPGWNHFAQFTIAVVNKDPKKSKYSDTLHRFCKKEHDWGWKKFMELGKILEGFTVADTLVIKAQVQVIRERPERPFRCLDWAYRRELVRVYLANVESICRRFIDEKREKLGKLLSDAARWSSLRSFWRAVEESVRRRLAREKCDVILRAVVKRFFNDKEVTSTLVMDALYSGCRDIDARSKFQRSLVGGGHAPGASSENGGSKRKGSSSSAELGVENGGGGPTGLGSAPVVLVEKDTFFLAGDILSLLERAVTEMIPPYKDDKGPQSRSKEIGGEEGGKEAVERDEKRLTELGRRTVEMFVLAHLFSNRVEVAYREAVALKRQEELIREEEAAEAAERQLSAQREQADKEKRSKKKQAKQRKKDKKEKEARRGKAGDRLEHLPGGERLGEAANHELGAGDAGSGLAGGPAHRAEEEEDEGEEADRESEATLGEASRDVSDAEVSAREGDVSTRNGPVTAGSREGVRVNGFQEGQSERSTGGEGKAEQLRTSGGTGEELPGPSSSSQSKAGGWGLWAGAGQQAGVKQAARAGPDSEKEEAGRRGAMDEVSSTCSSDSLASVPAAPASREGSFGRRAAGTAGEPQRSGSVQSMAEISDVEEVSAGPSAADAERRAAALEEGGEASSSSSSGGGGSTGAEATLNLGPDADTIILSLKERVGWLEQRLREKEEEVAFLQAHLLLQTRGPGPSPQGPPAGRAAAGLRSAGEAAPKQSGGGREPWEQAAAASLGGAGQRASQGRGLHGHPRASPGAARPQGAATAGGGQSGVEAGTPGAHFGSGVAAGGSGASRAASGTAAAGGTGTSSGSTGMPHGKGASWIRGVEAGGGGGGGRSLRGGGLAPSAAAFNSTSSSATPAVSLRSSSDLEAAAPAPQAAGLTSPHSAGGEPGGGESGGGSISYRSAIVGRARTGGGLSAGAGSSPSHAGTASIAGTPQLGLRAASSSSDGHPKPTAAEVASQTLAGSALPPVSSRGLSPPVTPSLAVGAGAKSTGTAQTGRASQLEAGQSPEVAPVLDVAHASPSAEDAGLPGGAAAPGDHLSGRLGGPEMATDEGLAREQPGNTSEAESEATERSLTPPASEEALGRDILFGSVDPDGFHLGQRPQLRVLRAAEADGSKMSTGQLGRASRDGPYTSQFKAGPLAGPALGLESPGLPEDFPHLALINDLLDEDTYWGVEQATSIGHSALPALSARPSPASEITSSEQALGRISAASAVPAGGQRTAGLVEDPGSGHLWNGASVLLRSGAVNGSSSGRKIGITPVSARKIGATAMHTPGGQGVDPRAGLYKQVQRAQSGISQAEGQGAYQVSPRNGHKNF